jgi:hypothetical protein
VHDLTLPAPCAARTSAWLNELREDIVNATLVSIVQNKGVTLDPRTAAAGSRGWQRIHVAAGAVKALHS